jgi:hypothetical protein
VRVLAEPRWQSQLDPRAFYTAPVLHKSLVQTGKDMDDTNGQCYKLRLEAALRPKRVSKWQVLLTARKRS